MAEVLQFTRPFRLHAVDADLFDDAPTEPRAHFGLRQPGAFGPRPDEYGRERLRRAAGEARAAFDAAAPAPELIALSDRLDEVARDLRMFGRTSAQAGELCRLARDVEALSERVVRVSVKSERAP